MIRGVRSRNFIANPYPHTPRTFMKFTPYLYFNGNCREAFDFYRDVFGGEITQRTTYGESPIGAQVPVDEHGLIIHDELDVGGAVLMGSDNPPSQAENIATGYISIYADSADEAERIFRALSAGGDVEADLQETFWAHRWAMFKDRFGKAWMVNFMK
jgi:PhnB protein